MSYARQPLARPSCEADRLTSMADARAAVALAAGVTVEDIDPASGYDHSGAACDGVRSSWIGLIRQHGASEFHEIRDIERARGFWLEKRPQFVEDELAGHGLVYRDKELLELDGPMAAL